MLVGRTRELDFLEHGYRQTGASLIALYGRRRTGKTELLKNFCRDKQHAFYVCRETTDAEQIRLFSRKILADSPMARYIERFPDWESAFSFLLERKDRKDVVIIDEFPYMIQINPAIPSILQQVWDERSAQGNTMLVLTGSSVQTMEQEILSGDRPLFGRTDGIYLIDELNWEDAMALTGAEPPLALQTVALLGGVPRYLAQFDPARDLGQNIRENLLRKGSALYSEVDCLMRQDLREPSTYYTILESLAQGDGRIARIAERTSLDRTKINVYLKNLQTLKVVARDEPVLAKQGSHNGRYRINGHYMRFYFRFMYPNYSLLEEGETERLYAEHIEPHLNGFLRKSYLGYAAERLRADHAA